MTSSHLTQAELDELQTSGLSCRTPFAIRGVSQTQFSIARYYGGMNYRGQPYTYIPETDQLIRDDVLEWLANRRKAEKNKPKDVEQPDLLDGVQ